MNNTPRHEPQESRLASVVWWATTVAWTLTIYQLSTVEYGVSLTGWMLQELLRLLSIQVSPETFHWLHITVRKLAHLSEYAVYSLLLYGSFGKGRDFRWVGRRALLCGTIAAGYSLMDELHQLFEPGRTGSLLDSALDTTGAIVGIMALYVYTRIAQSRARRSAASAAKAEET